MKHNQAPKQKNYETLGRELMQAAEARADSNPRKMSRGTRKQPLTDILGREPIVSKDHFSGNQQEGLTHVVVLGDGTVLGVTRNFNRPKNPAVTGEISNRYPVESVRISVLPLGPAAEKIQTSRTLFEVRTADLLKTRPGGYVQPWESVVVGREKIAEATDVVDSMISREHVEFAVGADGTLGITDRDSTNGTQILSMDDFGFEGLNEEGRQVFSDTRSLLQEKSYMWDKQHADMTAHIIEAQ